MKNTSHAHKEMMASHEPAHRTHYTISKSRSLLEVCSSVMSFNILSAPRRKASTAPPPTKRH